LAAILRDAGHEVTCFVESVQPFSWQELLNYKTVCFSVITCTADRTYCLVQKLRAARHRGTFIGGGPHATACPEEVLNAGIDIVARHEGDEVLLEVLEAIAEEKPLKDILGISWVSRSGQKHHNPDRPPLSCAKLSELPLPAFDLMLGYEKMSHVPLPGPRGCPNACKFCGVAPMFGRAYRNATVDWHIDQLREYRERYPELWWTKPIFFVADNFFGRGKWKEISLEFLRRIIAEGLIPPKGFTCQMEVRDATPEICQLLKAAGCKVVYVGVETDNPESLDVMNKPQSPEEIMVGLNNLHDAEMLVLAMTIAGADTDTFWSIVASNIRLRKQGNIDYLMVSFMTPLPDTEMTWELIKSGRDFSSINRLKDGIHTVLRPLNMSMTSLWLAGWLSMAWFYFWTRHGRGLIRSNGKLAAKMIGLMLWRAVSTPACSLLERMTSR
jgi:radical SAM superfamily enzyme YgiQ (UPF0313 family)